MGTNILCLRRNIEGSGEKCGVWYRMFRICSRMIFIVVSHCRLMTEAVCFILSSLALGRKGVWYDIIRVWYCSLRPAVLYYDMVCFMFGSWYLCLAYFRVRVWYFCIRLRRAISYCSFGCSIFRYRCLPSQVSVIVGLTWWWWCVWDWPGVRYEHPEMGVWDGGPEIGGLRWGA